MLVGDGGPTAAPVAFTFSDPDIVESSGLVARGGRFVTVNDSGDTGRVFTVDPPGDTVGTTGWGDAVDVEAVAPWAPGEVLVGDIGDNLGHRESVELWRSRWAAATGRCGDVVRAHLPRRAAGRRDADGAPEHRPVVVVTKSVFGGDVLSLPRPAARDRANRLGGSGRRSASPPTARSSPTAATSSCATTSRAVVYAWPSLRRGGGFDLPAQPQGEGIAVDPRGRVYVSTEGARVGGAAGRPAAAGQRPGRRRSPSPTRAGP